MTHDGKADDDYKPVDVIRDHRAVGCRVCPTEDGIKDTPARAAVQFRVAAVDVPNTLANIVRAWAGARLRCITANDLIPFVVFKIPDCLGEKTCGNQVQEAGRNDQKDLQGSTIATTICFGRNSRLAYKA